MAHDYLRDIVSNWEYDDSFDPVAEAWQYADAMQAEADKRKPSGLPESLRERHDFTEAIAKGVENYEKEEWQPDWSQAPSWANWWVKTMGDSYLWCMHGPIMNDDYFRAAAGSNHAPSFGYTGDWRNSLRKRPQ